MSLTGWSQKFEPYRAIDNVPERVRTTEAWYWCGLAFSIILLVIGIGMMLAFPQSPFGLFLGVCGAVDIALMKLWAHIRIATYQIIMELQLRDKK
jgi:hypothetical protein